MKVEGQFEFSNGGVVNTDIEKERIESVALHETVHSVLYMSTSLGLLEVMLEKSMLVAPEYIWLKDSLFNYMNRMQEHIAVMAEQLDIYSKKGEDEYKSAILKLKERNRTYYNYFRKLAVVNKFADDSNMADANFRILVSLGHMALDIKLEDIPFEKMYDSKDLQRFFSNEINRFKYLPNKRFKTLVNMVYRNIDNTDEIECLEEGSLENAEWKTDISIKSASDAIIRIFKNDYRYRIIKERIDSIGKNLLQFECGESGAMMVMPLDLEQKQCGYKYKLVPPDEFLNLISKRQFANEVVRLEHPMSGLEMFKAMTLCIEETGAVYYTFFTDDGIYLDIVKRIPQTLVFVQTKLFRKLKGRIWGIVQKLPVYILTENYVMASMEFIEKNFKNGYYSYKDEKEYSTLIVYRKKYVFIAYIIDKAKEEIDGLFQQKYNIEYVDFENISFDKEELLKVSRQGFKLLTGAHAFVENQMENEWGTKENIEKIHKMFGRSVSVRDDV